MSRNSGNRFWEIDFLRGIAIVMMIIFHVLSDLNFLGDYDINLRSGFWFYFRVITAVTFLILVGLSLTISYSKNKLDNISKNLFPRYFKRGLKIFSYGLVLTLLTFIFVRDVFIIFGILHLIGVSVFLAYPFLRYKYLSILIGTSLIFIGSYVNKLTIDSYWLVWLGISPARFATIDYYPLLPWFGIVLIGIFFGNLLYKDGIRRFKFVDLSKSGFVKLFSFSGRHSLIVYLIHQPILIILLYLLGLISINLP